MRRFEKLIASDPRIAGISGVARIPLWGMMDPMAAVIDGRRVTVASNFVDHRFFETVGIDIVRGRGFTPSESQAAADVAVVSERTARRLWPGREALRQTFLAGAEADDRNPRRVLQVIGVARDVVSGMFLAGTDSTLVYLPAAVGSAAVRHLIVRSRHARGPLVAGLQQACLEIDANGYCQTQSFVDVAWLQRFPVRMASQVAMALGGLALLLSCVGLYGVVSLTVVQRTREAGIRLALGASRWMVMRPMMASSLRGAAMGAGVGLPLCLAAAKWADSMAEFLHLADPAVFIAVPLLFTAVVTLATAIPARKASGADPSAALRQD